MKDAGVDFIVASHRPERHEDPRPGAASARAWATCRCTTRTPTTRRSWRRPATCSRATTSASAFRPFEADAAGSQLDTSRSGWTRPGSEITELAMIGWINADTRLRGPQGRRAGLRPGQGHRRHQRDHGLHRRRPASRRSTARGSTSRRPRTIRPPTAPTRLRRRRADPGRRVRGGRRQGEAVELLARRHPRLVRARPDELRVAQVLPCPRPTSTRGWPAGTRPCGPSCSSPRSSRPPSTPRRARGGGPALELGIGTGRIAVPLSGRGVRVAGIELSAAMVEQLARNPVRRTSRCASETSP